MSNQNARILITNFILLVVMMVAGMFFKSEIMIAIGILGIISVGHTCIIVEELTSKLTIKPNQLINKG